MKQLIKLIFVTLLFASIALAQQTVSVLGGMVVIPSNAGQTYFKVLLNQNVTSFSMLGPNPGGGADVKVLFVQDATGGRTVAGYASNIVNTSNISIASGANAVTLVSFIYTNTNQWVVEGSGGGGMVYPTSGYYGLSNGSAWATSHLNDGLTTAGTITSSEPLAVTGGVDAGYFSENGGDLIVNTNGTAGFIDFKAATALANPSAGYFRLSLNAGTSKLACSTSAGASCLPASGAALDLSNLTNPTAINDTTLTFAGAGGLTASGSNQNITLTPSGTGSLDTTATTIRMIRGGGLYIQSALGGTTTGSILTPTAGTMTFNTFSASHFYFANPVELKSQSFSSSGAALSGTLIGNLVTITLTGNVTSCSFSNLTSIGGAWFGFIDFLQDATGTRTLSCPSILGLGTVNTTAGKHNVQLFYYDGTNLRAVAPMYSY